MPIAIDPNERNRQLGLILARARERSRKTLEQCAARLGTTRKRYARIEQGFSHITAVELEQMVDYLDIPPGAVWPVNNKVEPETEHELLIRAQPGERIQVKVIVDVDEAPQT